MPLPLTGTIGLRKRSQGAPDAHGNRVESYAAAIPVQVYGWGPRSPEGTAEQDTGRRDLVPIGMTVYAPASVAALVDPVDRIEVPYGGDLFDVDGEVNDWSHGPFMPGAGCVITLRRAEG